VPEPTITPAVQVPTTVEEAFTLTIDQWIALTTELAGTVAAWDDDVKAAANSGGAGFAIDSGLGLFIVTYLTELFPDDIIDMSAVPVSDWRSLGTVAAIVFTAVQEFRARDE